MSGIQRGYGRGILTDFDDSYFDLCVDLFYSVFTSPEWGYDWLEKVNVKRYFEDMLATPRAQCYMYFIDGELVGVCFGCISDYFRTVQYCIKEVFVDIGRQGQGIGSDMLKAIEDDVCGYGVQNVTLYTLRTIKAFDFYMKNGYTVSPDSVYMVRFL